MKIIVDIPQQLSNKIKSLKEARHQINVWKKNGDKIVFTNGVFDLLHPGHVTYLQEASSLGDRLIVGLNADSSVKQLGKGDDRPINNEYSRALMLAAFSSVSLIVVFDGNTPLSIIKDFKPDVLVKGGDYDISADIDDPKYIVGSQEMVSWGGTVQSISFLEGYSSTKIINKIRGVNG